MPVCFPHELAGYKRTDYEGVQVSLLAIKILRKKQKEYSDSTKSKIDERRKKVPRRGDYPGTPKPKKPIKHIRRDG
jgi:hypothetical protein